MQLFIAFPQLYSATLLGNPQLQKEVKVQIAAKTKKAAKIKSNQPP